MGNPDGENEKIGSSNSGSENSLLLLVDEYELSDTSLD